jgi:CIC family chloride channel protein
MSLDKVIEQNFIQLRPEMSLREMLYDGVAKSSRNLFPVIDENSKMSGVILLDNIRECMFNQELYDKTKVSDYMIQPPDYIYYESDDMKTIMKKFQNTSAWNLPVIKNSTYYGFISKSKLLTSYRRQLINYTK